MLSTVLLCDVELKCVVQRLAASLDEVKLRLDAVQVCSVLRFGMCNSLMICIRRI